MLKSNSTLILFLSSFLFLLLLNNCKNEDDNNPGPVPNSSITSLTVSDIGDAGNGTDLQISFSKITNELKIKEYQIFVVPSAESASFNLEKAEGISTENLFTVAPTGNNVSINLAADSKNTSGELITNDIPYKVFVMSVTIDPNIYLNALSAASEEITLVDNGVGPNIGNISSLSVEDTANEGNGSDLKVSFSKVSDESLIDEYRIIVLKSDESAAFDLEKAETVTLDNYTAVIKDGNNISINLATDAKTNTGELIGDEIPYKVFVLAMSSDPALYSNTLSLPSEEITLSSVDKAKVTYIANDGIMIEFQDKKVIIDGINRASNLGGWVSPSNSALLAVENGTPPYDDIDVIMITHNHGDHYAISAVQNYLSNHPNTMLIAPSDVENNFSSLSSQIANFSINKFQRINVVLNGISIDVLQVEHFDQFGNIFSNQESYAYSVHFGDKKFLHVGDLDYVDSKLDGFNLLPDNITVAFIPTFGNLVSAANRDALVNNVSPDHIVGLHFLTNSMATTLNQINNVYSNADSFTTPFETREY